MFKPDWPYWWHDHSRTYADRDIQGHMGKVFYCQSGENVIWCPLVKLVVPTIWEKQ